MGPDKVFRLQQSPPAGAPLMITLKGLVLDFFQRTGRISATLDELARSDEIKQCWKQVGRIPLWKLLKQFPTVMEQKQQSNGVWLISLTGEEDLAQPVRLPVVPHSPTSMEEEGTSITSC